MNQNIEIILDEYTRLHNYSTTNSANNRNFIITAGISIYSVILTLSDKISQSNIISINFILIIFLPLLSYTALLSWLNEVLKMVRIGAYLLFLEKKINTITENEVIGWEKYIRNKKTKLSEADAYIIIVFIFLSLLSSVYGIFYNLKDNDDFYYQYMVCGILVQIFAIVFGCIMLKKYRNLSKK